MFHKFTWSRINQTENNPFFINHWTQKENSDIEVGEKLKSWSVSVMC